MQECFGRVHGQSVPWGNRYCMLCYCISRLSSSYIGGRSMSHLSEGRVSDSPYVEMIWRGRAGSAYAPTCPADSRWNLLLLRRGDGKLTVSVEGPLTKAKAKTH